jgi:glycosyltransferase involved in cell wall biosynthesis
MSESELKMSELITISIPTYRRPSLLLHAVHSCLLQDYRPLEIDISDDSPSTESEVLVHSIPLSPGISLRYWRNSSPLKQAGNVNQLFNAARGSKLALLHDDDVLLPGTISALYDAFSMSENVIAAYGLQQVLHENGELAPDETVTYNSCAHRSPELTGLQRDVVTAALWMQFPNNSYLIKTELARSVGYRRESEIGSCCDADFGIRLALANRSSHFGFINRYTSQYRLMPSGQRVSRDGWWKGFDAILALQGLTPNQAQARNEILRTYAVEALIENALHGKRKRALEIFCSAFYCNSKASLKALYHLGLIAAPGLANIRERMWSVNREG